jgi:hypothetical protein
MGHRVDPQPRRLAVTDAAIEQIDFGRYFASRAASASRKSTTTLVRSAASTRA